MEYKNSEPFDIDDDEIDFHHTSTSAEDAEFDKIVGILEQILMDPGFTRVQNEFCDKHYEIFEDCKENKLEYTAIFNQYTAMVEAYIGQRLAAEIPGFTMKKLEDIVASRHEELSGEVFELLLSLGDFTEFKDLMICHKQSKNVPGGGGFDFSISGRGAGR